MVSRRAFLGGSLASAMALAGCGGDKRSLDPPEIRFNEDISEMGMFVTDPKFTVATLLAGEAEWLLFDDIGEFLKYTQHRKPDYDAAWVPDYNDESWIKAEDAWYLESPSLRHSPMGWGVGCFKDETSASAAVDELGGELYRWDTVFGKTWDMPPKP